MKNVIQVALIGTGGGYGECLVLNLGNNNWVVVDSCQDPYTKKSLPLEYLIELGVNIANDVKLVICTHWHDDHILGISELLKECKSSDFCMASSTDKEKFLLWVGFDSRKAHNDPVASSSKELSKCIKIIRERKSRLINAVQDRVIFSSDYDGIRSQITTLSPSDYVLQEFDKEISTLLKDYTTSEKIVYNTPNDKCVVIQINVNNQQIILGSDLEVSSDNRKGWLCILDHSTLVERNAKIFKIPHHGSENGHHERVWSEIIGINPIAALTPWSRGKKLPQIKMLRKYLEYTDHLYMTTQPNNNKPKLRDRRLSKAIEKFNSTVTEVKYQRGIICCKYDLSSQGSDWVIELKDGATLIQKDEINKTEKR